MSNTNVKYSLPTLKQIMKDNNIKGITFITYLFLHILPLQQDIAFAEQPKSLPAL